MEVIDPEKWGHAIVWLGQAIGMRGVYVVGGAIFIIYLVRAWRGRS